MEANAERAADDPTRDRLPGRGSTSAASAVSLPVTNRAGLLQVSPADGLTSLTRPPARAPARRARALLPRRRRGPSRGWCPATSRWPTRCSRRPAAAALRRVALLHTEGFAERELAGMLAFRLRRAGTARRARRAASATTPTAPRDAGARPAWPSGPGGDPARRRARAERPARCSRRWPPSCRGTPVIASRRAGRRRRRGAPDAAAVTGVAAASPTSRRGVAQAAALAWRGGRRGPRRCTATTRCGWCWTR